MPVVRNCRLCNWNNCNRSFLRLHRRTVGGHAHCALQSNAPPCNCSLRPFRRPARALANSIATKTIQQSPHPTPPHHTTPDQTRPNHIQPHLQPPTHSHNLHNIHNPRPTSLPPPTYLYPTPMHDATVKWQSARTTTPTTSVVLAPVFGNLMPGPELLPKPPLSCKVADTH